MINCKKMSTIRMNIILGVCALCMLISFQRLPKIEYLETVEAIESIDNIPEKGNVKAIKISQYIDTKKIEKQKNVKQKPLAQIDHVDRNSKDVLGKLKVACDIQAFPQGTQHNKEVQKYVRQFRQEKSEKKLGTAEVKSNLNYIVSQVEKRDLPGSLALIPMVESNFKMHAKSHKGAVGLWQFMPRTGRALGLKCSAGYDGRKDVKASTHAALNYLEYLHKKFNKDWMLALAAYNAGEGTVSRAMQRNRREGKATSFWSLKLPFETKQYVPKIVGLTHYIKQLN